MNRNKKIAYITVVFVIAVIAYSVYWDSYKANPSNGGFVPKIGNIAPNYSFVYASNGTIANISSLRGKTVLLWFVATWCSGCAQGNEILNGNMSFFESRGIDVIEVELYKDLGYSGEPISSFVAEYAPNASAFRDFHSAISGYNLSLAYDGRGYLDIYYLIGHNGTVIYENNGTLAATMGQLKNTINRL
ncbi:MAG: redoxin domain-containing protein [Candidatus Marsarchaeota archaeon]|nr:redoxin domain-containing protein [Candidatus Marsarchaeota archaeon]MCL5102107.1 redoxin domain-containing protein [Candidatus Marsarchaeota archaeon]